MVAKKKKAKVVEAVPKEDGLKLKRDHTHLRKIYPAGTLVMDMGVSESTLNYMKEHGIV